MNDAWAWSLLAIKEIHIYLLKSSMRRRKKYMFPSVLMATPAHTGHRALV
jgi:hypothetical protein